MSILKVATTMISTGANGPGRRFVLWLQGCSLGCGGCFNPELWDRAGGHAETSDALLERILARPDIEGVTFTGGEPLEQAEALLPLAKGIQSRGLDLLCYTGYRYEDILQGKAPNGRELVELVDILIDGPYEQQAKEALLWRGSRNQRVLFLTERYRHLAPLAKLAGRREAEIQIGEQGVSMTGIFELALWSRLKKKIIP